MLIESAKSWLKEQAYREIYQKRILKRADVITSGLFIGWPEKFSDEFANAISEGYVPVVYSNHQSWYDGLPIARVGSKLAKLSKITDRPVDGFVLPIAASLPEGQQDEILQKMFFDMEEYLKKRGLDMISVVRGKDKEKFGMEGNNTSSIRQLIKAVRSGKGVAMFPEGSVQGGRKDEN